VDYAVSELSFKQGQQVAEWWTLTTVTEYAELFSPAVVLSRDFSAVRHFKGEQSCPMLHILYSVTVVSVWMLMTF